jgi:hypothetical protein
MILHGKHVDYWRQSFIFRALSSRNDFWTWRLFTDHLSISDTIKYAKYFLKDRHVFISLESSVHSIKYMRPYSLSEFNISHKNKINTIYYNLFVEEYLGNLFTKITINEKIPRTIFISSNYQKINFVMQSLKNKFNDLDFYGGFSKNVPSQYSGLYHKNSQSLMAGYDSAICIENSFEDGYIQGSFMPALLSGTVPIIYASNSIKENVLNQEIFIDFNEFIQLSEKDQKHKIADKKNNILNGKPFFTNLASEYINFCSEINFFDVGSLIKHSQVFKENLFNLQSK